VEEGVGIMEYVIAGNRMKYVGQLVGLNRYSTTD